MNSIKCIIVALLAGLLAVLPGIQTAQAARTFNGTSDYIEAGSAVVTVEPLTMACWFKPANVTVAKALMSIGTSGGMSRFVLTENQTASQPILGQSVNSGGTIASAVSAGSVSAGAWHHAAAVFTSSASRTAYLSGVGGTTETTSITVSGINRTLIGARISTTVGLYAAADISEAAIWSAALTADEISSLAKGFSPRLIRPQSLVFYAPLVRSVTDIRGGVALTDTVPTTAASTHPPVRN